MSLPFTFRPGTCDAEVFHAINVVNEYRLPDSFEPDDIILDIGTHIGSFCHAVLARGADHVYGFEPFVENFELAKRNLRQYGDRVKLANQAVWRSDAPVATLSFSSVATVNAAGHVIDADHGVPVEAVAFDDIVLRVTENGKKRVRMVKLDCEGSEFPILFTSRTLHLIDSFVGEYHNFSDNYPEGVGEDHFFHKIPAHAVVRGHDRFIHDDLCVCLHQHGFRVLTIPHPKIPNLSGWFYANRITRPTAVRDRLQWHWHGLKYKLAHHRRKAG